MGFLDILKNVVDALSQKQPTNNDSDNNNANALPVPVVSGTDNLNKPNLDTNAPSVSNVVIDGNNGNVYSYHIADLAEKYETSNRGPGYISNGSKWGDPGGDSYGSYQIETKQGTMAAYLRTNDMFTNALRSYSMNSAAFKQCWTELATNFPEQFQQSQFDFLCKKANGYNDAIAYAQKIGMMYNNFAMQSAVFSTSNQSGGWKIIFNNAKIQPSDSIEIQLNKLYDARARYFLSLSSLTRAIKNSILQQRCGKMIDKNGRLIDYPNANERKDCLKLINRG